MELRSGYPIIDQNFHARNISVVHEKIPRCAVLYEVNRAYSLGKLESASPLGVYDKATGDPIGYINMIILHIILFVVWPRCSENLTDENNL